MKKQKQTESHYISSIEEETVQLLQITEETKAKMEDYYIRLLDKDSTDNEIEALSGSLKRAQSNITTAFSQIFTLRDELDSRWNDIKRQKKKRFFKPAPANTAIDAKENSLQHFAKGLNLYKLLLICYIGSFVGVVIESLWCLFRNGYLESRVGLVYGPFNLLYGAGAVALTLCLYRFRNRSSWISFAGGMIVGSIVEYVCSWGQEMVFGSCSWDYSRIPFNINGRICLLYSIFWGFLGALWIKELYPRIAKWILKIPNRTGKIVTWLLLFFFLFDAFMSSVSVFRWTQRVQNIAPQNAFMQMIDERFPDERMENIYANMKFIDK